MSTGNYINEGRTEKSFFFREFRFDEKEIKVDIVNEAFKEFMGVLIALNPLKGCGRIISVTGNLIFKLLGFMFDKLLSSDFMAILSLHALNLSCTFFYF